MSQIAKMEREKKLLARAQERGDNAGVEFHTLNAKALNAVVPDEHKFVEETKKKADK